MKLFFVFFSIFFLLFSSVAQAQYYPRIDPYRWSQNRAYRTLNPWYGYPSGPYTWSAPHVPHYATRPNYAPRGGYDWGYGGGNRGYLGGRGGGWGGEW